MITAKLNGGLGNQMFQIAAAVAIAIDNGDEYAFDFSREVAMQGNKADTYRKIVYLWLRDLPSKWEPQNIFKESSIHYKKIPYSDNMMLVGYFQSYKYFEEYSHIIKEVFTHERTLSDLRKKYKSILTGSVAIHVRRGDYVPLGESLPIEYYFRALNTLWSVTDTDNVLVFSDDIAWCKENLPYVNKKPIHYISGNKDYEDMYLMSLCSHCITANSSFSWWAAYLNRNDDSRIIMPKPWTVSHVEDIYIPNSIIIPR